MKALKHIQATLYLYVLKWEASAVFPGEVLSGGDGVPRKQGFPSVCRRLFLLCVLMALTVVVHLFVADSSLLDCCDLVVFLPPYVCR